MYYKLMVLPLMAPNVVAQNVSSGLSEAETLLSARLKRVLVPIYERSGCVKYTLYLNLANYVSTA